MKSHSQSLNKKIRLNKIPLKEEIILWKRDKSNDKTECNQIYLKDKLNNTFDNFMIRSSQIQFKLISNDNNDLYIFPRNIIEDPVTMKKPDV